MNKTLLISLSKESTGETRFWISAIKLLIENKNSVHLLVNPSFQKLYSDFQGEILFYDFKSKNNWIDLSKKIKTDIEKYKKIIFLDITSATLENNLSKNDLSIIMNVCLEFRKICEIAFFDVMGVIEKSPDSFEKRVSDTTKKLTEFIKEYILIKGMSSDQRSYYFSRFLKVRTINQLLLLPEKFEIIRAIPYTFPQKNKNNDKMYFQCNFEKINVCKCNKRKIILGFSKFTDKSVASVLLSDLFEYVANQLNRKIEINEIVLINPIGFEINKRIKDAGVNVRNYERLERNQLLQEMSDVYFVAFFIPTATVGVTAIQNGIPFISFYSSSYSSKFIKHQNKDDFIPKFTSLGIWEDVAFFDELTDEINPYFKTVEFVDVSKDEQFINLKNSLESGKIKVKMDKYNQKKDAFSKPFSEILYSKEYTL